MSEFRRHLMKAVYGGMNIPYITDGLIFWLDGINTGSSSNSEWVDLIGGASYTAQGTVTREEDGFSVNDDTSKFYRNASITGFISPTFTLEIVLKNKIKDGYIFYSGNQSKVMLSTYRGYTTLDDSYKVLGNVGWNSSNWVIASMNKNVGLFDINKSYSNKYDYWNLNSDYSFVFAGLNNNRGFQGEICCIRIYNRLLDATEMAQNQIIDNTRFNLGL